MDEQTLHQADENETPTEPNDDALNLDDAPEPAASEGIVEKAEETEEVEEVGAPPTEAQDADVQAVVEAILFASDAPLPPAKIATIAEWPPRRVKKAVRQLNDRYAKAGHSFRIEEIAGGLQMMTLPEYHDVLRRLFNVKKDSRLSQAAMETLAIVAYRQPILRADIEAIRGVASGEVLRGLLERQLMKIVGRADVIGRPMLYGTTKRFLEVFGLNRLEDLPRVEELRSGAEKQNQPTPKKQEGEEASAEVATPTNTPNTETRSTMVEDPSNEPEDGNDDDDDSLKDEGEFISDENFEKEEFDEEFDEDDDSEDDEDDEDEEDDEE